eukprot:CAMPEP_0118645704 /NCGR_PEP_ID=MMETSP0785-20121206/7648_1 /TAXON_ID=91992 /ORGANISM="Bolidomonas pacifica, Strain CCMP 1866" /LENGTH=220 /DNA_ID=CAMNT_0006537615 /DNA_START=381 /DNA_END=1040 /DNA_ORIENTATION=+
MMQCRMLASMSAAFILFVLVPTSHPFVPTLNHPPTPSIPSFHNHRCDIGKANGKANRKATNLMGGYDATTEYYDPSQPVRIFLPSQQPSQQESGSSLNEDAIASTMKELSIPYTITAVPLPPPDWYVRISPTSGPCLPSVRLKPSAQTVCIARMTREELADLVREYRTTEGDAFEMDNKAIDGKIVVTYCPGCGWLHRSQWYVTELLLTFNERRTSKGLR